MYEHQLANVAVFSVYIGRKWRGKWFEWTLLSTLSIGVRRKRQRFKYQVKLSFKTASGFLISEKRLMWILQSDRQMIRTWGLSRCAGDAFTFKFAFLIPSWDLYPEQPTLRTAVWIILTLRSTALQAQKRREYKGHASPAHATDVCILIQMYFNCCFIQMIVRVKELSLCVFCRIQSGSYLSTGWFTLILAMDMCKEIHIYGMINDTYCK